MTGRVLLVSDSDELARSIERGLAEAGFADRIDRVASVADFPAALQNAPTLVIAACESPACLLSEVTRLLRRSDPDLPLIIIGASPDAPEVAASLRDGANEFLATAEIPRLGTVIARRIQIAGRSRERRLQEAAHRTEERYRLVVDYAPMGIYVATPEGRCQEVNDRFCQITGYRREELIGHSISEITHPEDLAQVAARMERLLQGDADRVSYDRRYLRSDGGEVWTHVWLSLAHDREGNAEAFFAVVEEISARQAALEQIRMQRRLLDCVQEAVIATDLHGSVTYWNLSAERLYGRTSAEAFGLPILDLIATDQSRVLLRSMLELKPGESRSGEVDVRRRDGNVFPARVAVSSLVDEEGQTTGIVATSRDITPDRRVSDELRQREIQLNEAQQIANVGSWEYDLRTERRRWSRQMFAIHGLEVAPNPTPGMIREVVHEKDRDTFDEWIHSTAQGSPLPIAEYRVLRSDGLRHIRLLAQVLLDAAGEPSKVVGIAQDLTESRMATLLLEQQSAQQATVANLGQIALSRATLALLFDVAANIVAEILRADVCEILVRRGTKLQIAGQFGLPPHFVGSALIDGGERSQAVYVSSQTDPVVIDDLQREDRFEVSPLLFGEKLVTGISLPIHIRSGAWGILSAYFRAPRVLTSNETQFLRGVATILGHGIERRKAEEELMSRAAQQSAVATLGHRALTSVGDVTYDLCCQLIRDTLGVDFAALLHLLPDRTFLLGGGTHPAASSSGMTFPQAAFALGHDLPVAVSDYERETRFETASWIAAGIRSGLSVPIRSGLSTFAVIEAGSRDLRHFSETDLQFVRAMANVLAEAMERELATQALMDSEARYRDVIKGASEIIYTVSSTGVITSLNPAFEAISGWRVDEWIGRPFLDLVPAEQQRRLEGFPDVVMREKRAATTDAFFLARDGRHIQVETTIFPKVVNGEIREIYGFARDVTEARHAEDERVRASRELERILESTAEGVYAIDCEGRCTMVNRAAAEMLGYPREDWIGRDTHDLLHPTWPDGKAYPRPQCSLHGSRLGSVSSEDETFHRFDGSPLPVVATASEIRGEGGPEGFVITFRDMTEHRQMQLAVEQANRLTSLGRLAATIAHEFNNVLMGISPFVDLLRRETNTPRAVMALDQMTKSISRGKGITEEILRFTQSAGPVLTAIDCEEWLRTLANEAENVTGPGYTVRMECVEGVPPLLGDPNQLHQSLMNLVINARDAMPSGGVITLRAERGRPDGDYPFGSVGGAASMVHLSVEDNGPGIDPTVLNHIFEPLFTTKKHGTGLGLAVMHQVVMRHQGKVFVDSELGKGTAFHLFVPAASPESVQQAPAVVRPLHTRFHQILLVEDEPTVSMGLAALLRSEGMRVEVADTGRAALASLERNRPDLVVLDIGLPDMQGTEVYKVIAERYPALPVLFSTGHGDRADLEEYLARGHTGFLLKPYGADTFFHALEELERSTRRP